MKAKDLFKELGYIDYYEDTSRIIYSHSFELRFKEIIFYKLLKNVSIGKNIDHDYTHYLSYDEIIAINKQIEELKWHEKN